MTKISTSWMPSQSSRNQPTYSSGTRTARNAHRRPGPSIPMRAASARQMRPTCRCAEGPAPALPPGPVATQGVVLNGPRTRMAHRRGPASRGWDRIVRCPKATLQIASVHLTTVDVAALGGAEDDGDLHGRVTPIGCGAGSPPGPCPATALWAVSGHSGAPSRRRRRSQGPPRHTQSVTSREVAPPQNWVHSKEAFGATSASEGVWLPGQCPRPEQSCATRRVRALSQATVRALLMRAFSDLKGKVKPGREAS